MKRKPVATPIANNISRATLVNAVVENAEDGDIGASKNLNQEVIDKNIDPYWQATRS